MLTSDLEALCFIYNPQGMFFRTKKWLEQKGQISVPLRFGWVELLVPKGT